MRDGVCEVENGVIGSDVRDIIRSRDQRGILIGFVLREDDKTKSIRGGVCRGMRGEKKNY